MQKQYSTGGGGGEAAPLRFGKVGIFKIPPLCTSLKYIFFLVPVLGKLVQRGIDQRGVFTHIQGCVYYKTHFLKCSWC